MNDGDELDRFYARVTQQVDAESFLALYAQVNQFVVATGLVSDRRTARGRLKRLRDEIQPVAHFVTEYAARDDIIQFPLDSGPLDCRIWHGASRLRLVQITVAQAKERMNLMRLLNRVGQAWGLLGLNDDQGKAAFEAAIDRGPAMHSTQQAQSTMVRAVELCLHRKQKNQGADTLLIDAPLEILPPERWQDVLPDFSEAARHSPFAEVFVVGREIILPLK